MTELFGLLAVMVVIMHLGFILFVMMGVLLVLHWPRLMWLHLPAVLWAFWIQIQGGYCPLTPFEKWLRLQAGQASYSEGFIQHYLEPVIYPAGLRAELHTALGILLLVFNGFVYLFILRRRRNTRLKK